MSKNNVRIAIRDSTDSHNVAFFDNKAGIKYKSANLQRFLAGSASILTLKYSSKDIDSIRSGCKLAFRYKNRDYWLNVMNFEKKGFEVELTAYSLGLELNNETRGEHKPANAMSIAEYVAYYDPEHALTIGVNEVSDKRIKLEWTGTDTILARLFSVANSFGAELDFSVELNDDYSLKRQVLNIYKKGNLGTNKVSQPVRVGKELKVINYSDNIKELRTAVRATGKDGLTIDGLNKKIYDSNKQLLYYSSGMTVYAPQSRDRFPSVGKGSNDNWIVEDLGETQYETKEALWGYLYSEIQKKSVPEITYEVEGAIEAGIGDTQTLIDDIHFEPALYVQARVSELEDDILTGKVTKSTFINFERKYSQIADILLKQVEALAEDAAPYIIRLSTNNGYIFKNGEGSSTITARLEKYSKDIAATWKWVVDNKVVGTGDKLTVKAEQVTNTMAVTVIAYVNGNEVVRDYMTFSNSDDGVGVESIDRYFTSSDQSDGVTIEGAEWSDKPPAPTEDGKYLWAYDEITYTDGTVTTTKPAAVGANFDVDAFRAEIAEDLKDVPNREEFENKIAEELATSKAEIETQIETAKTQAESNAKEYADTINQETAKVAELANAAADEIKADLVNVKNNLTDTSLVANNAQAAVDAAKQELAEVNTKVDSAKAELTQAKQDLTEVANELNTAKQDLADSVAEVNTKVDNTKKELTQAKQQLTTVTDDLSQAKTDLQTAVSEVDTKAANLKSDLSQAKQDLASQAQQLQAQANAQSELTKRVSSVEKTADGTKTTVNELTKTVAQNGKDITSVTARTKVVEDDLTSTKTTLSQVQTTADSASQKTAMLESGLDGLTAKFNSLSVGSVNLFKGSRDFSGSWTTNNGVYAEDYQGVKIYKTQAMWNGRSQYFEAKTGEEYVFSAYVKSSAKTDRVTFYLVHESKQPMATGLVGFDYANRQNDVSFDLTDEYQRIAIKIKITKNGWIAPRIERSNTNAYLFFGGYKLECGNVATDYTPSEADIEQKVAEYKQNADQNYASLQTTVQNLDGTVQHNKTVADQTAQGFKTRIESLETYKNGESERANAYFESAKTETAKQLTAERTAIAKDYVAKSTYTSDVTGIRNDLSATTTTANTTKTNLANYQASNDKMVASLKSSLQTTDGNVSNLQTKVEAVPGQITSAVSAVEGKIPTSVGGRNLAQGTSKDWSTPFTGFSGVQNTCPNLYRVTTDGLVVGDTFKTRIILKYTDIRPASGKIAEIWIQGAGNVTEWNSGAYPSGGGGRRSLSGSGEIVFELTDKINADHLKNSYWDLSFRTDWIASGSLQWKLAKAEKGMFFTDWSPAPEDTVNQISNLSSQIKQTADGITLLATKTELNTAKNELQSGINTATNKANSNAQTISTHTTQISALNTGLSAKVSQTDFNTLSGRVTTAENNITAKANELSSKISSVEGKIPTEIGSSNLLRKTAVNTENLKLFGGTDTTVSAVKKDGHQVYKLTVSGSNNAGAYFKGNDDYYNLVKDRNYTFSFWVLTNKDKNFNMNSLGHIQAVNTNGDKVGNDPSHQHTQPVYSTNVIKASTWTKVWCTFKATSNSFFRPYFWYLTAGDEIYIYDMMLNEGKIPLSYTPAVEDAQSDITKLSSEIKQTADGMTLLATKTELNSAKNELQSGISTATNKANAAQNTANNAQNTANSAQNKANNNAQTISTHTTQISALNTGLSAKVSQTDFNTLSGRVTTAENNITAKANELSSKISSVEGKIPTEIGSSNLLRKTAVNTENLKLFGGTDTTVSAVKKDGHQVYKLTVSGSNNAGAYFKGNDDYYNLVKDRNYTFSFWVLTNKDKNFNMNSLGHIQAVNTNGDKVGNDPSHQHTQPVYSTNVIKASTWTKVWCTFKATSNSFFRPYFWYLTAGDEIYIYDMMLNEGKIPLSYTPAVEDAQSDITKLSSEIKQTADGMTLLATKTELNTAKNELQSGITTATNKANSNAQTISTHTTQISALNTGLSAKVSQTDFNTLSGRVTTAENNITAKANELSSKITSVEGKIPTAIGSTNLLLYSADPWKAPSDYYQNAGAVKTDETLNGSIVYKTSTAWSSLRLNLGKQLIDRKNVKVGDEFTYSVWMRTDQIPMKVRLYARYSGQSNAEALASEIALTNEWQKFSVTFKVTQKMVASQTKLTWFGFEQTTNSENGKFVYYTCNKIERGNIATDYSPNPEDYDSKLATAQSEFKQTTDAIKASVSSLDKSTVKSSSLTINADGIVMKAGKSTTDVANAIGSYFAVNQNAINLFSDKINVKGNMIVNGAITSDKIASKSINTAHLNGKIITADVISSNAVTAGAIKAGAVTTDKMSANSINGDRIAAGTLDAAKIKAGSITASQIASGTITSNQIKAGGIRAANIAAGAITTDKIAAGAIDANKIAANAISSDKIVSSGITANVIKGGTLQSLNGSTNFELDTGKLFYNNNNTGVFRVQNGASTMGLKFSNTPITVNGTSRILSRAILGGDRNENTLDDGKWDKGGFSGLVIETIKGAIPAVNEHADSLRAISDTIYFTHTYSADSPTGVSAHGWKMETYAPDSSYSGNIVLKPYGINYRQSDIIVGDVRLDNGDGSGYWMRATINTLKACFGHILNGGVSSSALNAIRSELDKISGT